MKTAFFRIGRIVRAHGVHGAVKLDPTTDALTRFRGLCCAYLEEGGAFRPVKILETRLLNDAVVLQLEGIDTVEQAEKLRGTFLCVDRAHAAPLPADTYYIADLVGCEASDTNGVVYGRVTDVMQLPAGDVYEIEHGKLQVPALKRVLHEVDTENGRIVFDAAVLLEVGLFED